MQQGVCSAVSVNEVLRGMPEREAVARDARQDALSRYERYVELAELTERQAFAVALRVGLGPSSEPLPITAIALEFGGVFGEPVTRQFVSALIQRAKEKLREAKLFDAFAEDFPVITSAKLSELYMSEKRAGERVRRALRRMPPDDPIDYAKIVTAAGVKIPEHRLQQIGSMTEEQSMAALYEDFDATMFGSRGKICSVCKQPKPLSEFYRAKTGTGKDGLSYLCRSCNTIRCRELRNRRRMQRI